MIHTVSKSVQSQPRIDKADKHIVQSLLRIPALAKGIIVTERAIEWNFVCDYATSYQVTDETNMAPAPTISTPPSDNASRNSNGFHSNGFYDVKLRNVSSTDFTGCGDVGEKCCVCWCKYQHNI